MTREDFLTRMVALADMVQNFTLSPELLAMYEKMLAPYGYDRVCQALEHIMTERDSRDPFPSIKSIRSTIEPESDPQSAAVLAAHKIVEAVKKDGYTNWERARDRMGKLAWQVVSMSGGWTAVCESLTDRNQNQSIAQWRDLAKALQTSGHLPAPDPRPRLPGATSQNAAERVGLGSFGQLMKQIETKKGESHGQNSNQEESREANRSHDQEEKDR